MTLVNNQEVDVAIELVLDEVAGQKIVIHDRQQLMEEIINVFPEHENAIRSEFEEIDRQCRQAALTYESMQREYFESRWV